ncbi:MAG TPA: wax ester/triacylglycerol synthase family O-acyltransferase [Baekduia sp.]|nr:wax ester/triacylglycerol synthase family O-acyltransferase [Baekduia sp.]
MTSTKLMTSADAAWYRMDRPTNRMIITSVLTFGGPLDPGALRRLLVERLVEPFPRFRQVVGTDALGRLRWQDAGGFDIDVHVHRRALPAPGGRTELQELVGDLMSTGLDPLKPLWDVHLVEGYGPGCALVIRMHHCIADGIVLARVLMTLTDAAGEGAGVGDGGTGTAQAPGRGLLGTLVHESLQSIAHPRHAAGAAAGAASGAVREAVADAAALVALLGAPSDPETVLKDDALGMAQRVAWTPPLPLADIKALAHATGTTVNDVLMAALAGGLRRYLAGRGQPAEELHAMVPFNLRPLDEPLPRDLGNRFALVLLALPLTDRSPRERLDHIHEHMEAVKASRQPAVSYATLQAAGLAPAQAETALIDFMTSKSTAVVTNVPGPRETVELTGVPLEEVLVWAPCAGSIGMTVSMFSYRDAVTVGYMTHTAQVPDPLALADATVAELDALRAAAA